jgi:hypothetical protein
VTITGAIGPIREALVGNHEHLSVIGVTRQLSHVAARLDLLADAELRTEDDLP